MAAFILGLTGGIGSGKSVASKWFEEQGIHVVDADLVARQIVAMGQPALEKIKQAFGDWVILENGELNRSALRLHIFSHPQDRKLLEDITHPLIRTEMIRQLSSATSPYVILVSPLLFETGQHLLTQHTLLIDAHETAQLDRASQRDDQNIDQIKKIIEVQMSRQKKQQLANDIILNDGNLAQLFEKLALLHQKYLTKAYA